MLRLPISVLGSAATVLYTKDGDKNLATSIEFVPAKGE